MAERSRARRLALSGVALLSLLPAQACQRGPSEVPLEVLVRQQESYLGKIVSTSGVVRRIEDVPDDTHYVLEDETSNRVELVPGASAAAWIGREVVVTGRFDLRETSARMLTIETIRPRNR